MSLVTIDRCAPCGSKRRANRAAGFTLVELLTVMFIISALIAILIPSLNAARNAAKKTSTMAAINSLRSSLDLFRQDNQRQFVATNGYPPSFAHPRILNKARDDIFDPCIGEFPFHADKPVVTGAHWLPAMLMGFDQLGYIDPKKVTKEKDLRYKPELWYTPDPLGDGTSLERVGLYADPSGLKTVRTQDLPGRPGQDFLTSDTWDTVKDFPVIVDAWGQPLLYYAANANGTTSNMVSDKRNCNNDYGTEDQEKGPPFYFHQDNHVFTGDEEKLGWDFDGEHAIARSGALLTAKELLDPANLEAKESFARFIVDRALLRTLDKKKQEEGKDPPATTPLRPVNAESYLLISPGVDGRYGTSDDVTNFPLAAE